MDNSAVGSFTRLVFQVDNLGNQVKELGAKPLYLDEEKSVDVNFYGKILDKPIPIPKILYENLILLPCSLTKMVLLMILAKLKWGKFISIR